MSDLALTLVRLAFLALLWGFVLVVVLVLSRDLRRPTEAIGGVSLSSLRAPRKPSRPRRARGSKLVVTEGALSGTVIPLTGTPVTLGRAPDSTLVIEDDYTSSMHARVFVSEAGWMVEDLGSTNGTWLDRTRITSPTPLPVGIDLRVGRTTMQLRK